MKKLFSWQTGTVLLFLLSIVPAIVGGYYFTSNLSKDIQFVRKEKAGAEYISSLRKLLEHIPQHRGMSSAYLSGDLSFRVKCLGKQTRIENELKIIDGLDEKHGVALRSTEGWAGLKLEWQELKEAVFTLQPAVSFDRHTALVAEVISFISHIANTSGITLDPELDIYYLARVMTVNLSWLSEYLGQARGSGAGILARKIITPQEKAELLILSGRINMTMDELRRSWEVVLRVNPRLDLPLKAHLKQSLNVAQEFLELLRERLIDADSPDITPEYCFEEGTKAIDACFVVYDTISPLLQKLWQARIDRLSQKRYWGVIFTLFIGLIVICAYAVFTHNLGKRRRAEKRLLESEVFNQALLQSIPFGMDVVDEKGNILFLSKIMESKFGKEALGKRCWSLYKDDKEQCVNCPLKKDIRIGEVASLEVGGVGGGRSFLITHTGMYYQGKKAILEIFQDITERKETEKELKLSQDTLQRKLAELERFRRITVDRESRMIELKEKMARLEKEREEKK